MAHRDPSMHSGMAGAPRRNGGRLHFSLCALVVVVMGAGVLLGLNLLQDVPRITPPIFSRRHGRYDGNAYGWPITAFPEYVRNPIDWEYDLVPGLEPLALVFDIVVCVAILLVLGWIVERSVKKREALRAFRSESVLFRSFPPNRGSPPGRRSQERKTRRKPGGTVRTARDHAARSPRLAAGYSPLRLLTRSPIGQLALPPEV